MESSILEFARDFETLKGRLKKQQSSGYRLLLLNQNWSMLRDRLNDPKYRTFVVEYATLLLDNLKAPHLTDLLLPELTNLMDVVSSLAAVAVNAERVAELQSKTSLLAREAAVKSFYAGDIKNGLKLLAEAVDRPLPELKSLPDDSLYSEIELLQLAQTELSESSEVLYKAVGEIVTEWETALLEISVNSAYCLFVELDSGSELSLGRLLKLYGSIKIRKENIKNDEVTFENQLVSFDDPFTGTIYNSLKAVRAVTDKSSPGNSGKSFYEGRYRVKNCYKELFAGDSIGLASGLIGYTQLLEPLLLRYERFITAEAAFTGGLDENGRLLPVNEKTLPQKIERAFFSHIKYLVMPETNLQTARECLAGLQRKYPRRKIHLIGAESLSDTIENHNVIRPEKVCLGQFVARRVYKYSRATKVQVPLLVLLLYLLVSLIFPRAWIGFDWNPEYVRITEKGFEALNADSLFLWSVEFDCESIEPTSAWKIGDLDGDGKNEVAFSPTTSYAEPCSEIGIMSVYDNDGEHIFSRDCWIPNQYPGDFTDLQDRNVGHIAFVNYHDTTSILTTLNLCNPSRTHIRLWSSRGDTMGWYINAGATRAEQGIFTNAFDIGLIFLGINNRMGAATLFVLPRDSFYGVSPPYTETHYNLENVIPGNQIYYIIFPPSDVCLATGRSYNGAGLIHVISDGILRLDITEATEGNVLQSLIYHLNAKDFRVDNVSEEDGFVRLRTNLIKRGELSLKSDLRTYSSKMRDNVAYWIDSGWVTEGQLRDAGL